MVENVKWSDAKGTRHVADHESGNFKSKHDEQVATLELVTELGKEVVGQQ